MSNTSRRLEKVEKKLKPEEDFVLPRLIVKRYDPNDEEKDVIYIGGPANKRRNNGQETIETA